VPGVPRGPRAYRQILASYRAAFADFSTRVEEVVAEDDRVAVLTTTSGRHTGAFLGHAPTGAAFTATGVDVLWIAGGRIARRAGAFDALGMLRQLGLYAPAGDAR
jgi:predicted ester cyclase